MLCPEFYLDLDLKMVKHAKCCVYYFVAIFPSYILMVLKHNEPNEYK